MRRGHRSTFKPEGSVVEAALDAMDAEALRQLIRGVLPWLDDKLHAKVTGEIIDQAARSKSEWAPDAPNDESVAEVLEFAEAAQRVGYADPSEVDDYLRQGMNAFLAKDYRAAFQVFRALIIPLSEGEIDRGHRDFDEVEMIGRVSDEPRLHSPSVDDVLALAGIDKVEDSSARAAMLKAMQKAAKKRLDGVTENKRRRYYGHTASLAGWAQSG